MASRPSDPDAAPLSRSARFVRGASLVVAIVGTAVFFDWMMGFDRIRSLPTGTSTMKANTALLFLLSGAALWLAATTRERRAVRVLAGIVVAVALVTLGQYAFDRDFGVDQLLVADHAPVPLTAPPGRMGINTAMAFVLTGIGLVLAVSRRSRVRRLGQWLPLTSAALGAVSLTGYAYSVQSTSGLTSYTQMAVHTSLLHALVGLGVVFVNAREGIAGVVTSAGPGGQFTRSVMPYLVLGPFAMGWLRLQGQKMGFYGTEFGVAILVIVSTGSLVSVVMLYASKIDRADAAARAA